jgi:hypothetical protein
MSIWRVITVTNEPWGRKARPITDITSIALEKEQMMVRLWHVDLLLGNDCEINS